MRHVAANWQCPPPFPNLHEQDDWDNSLSEDGTVITEVCKNSDRVNAEKWDRRIVMAKSRDELNRTLYRFVGVFEVIPEYRSGNGRKFRRVATSVKTYSPKQT